LSLRVSVAVTMPSSERDHPGQADHQQDKLEYAVLPATVVK